jgi:type I site-specific restriction endonuclease
MPIDRRRAFVPSDAVTVTVIQFSIQIFDTPTVVLCRNVHARRRVMRIIGRATRLRLVP